MNRSDAIQQVLIWEQVAAAARAKATKLRDDLTADARAEYAEQGTAPTWRLPDIGTVSLPVSKETVYVADEQAFLDWAQQFHSGEVETVTRVRASFRALLLAECRGEGDMVVWMREGALVPGLAVREGGQPGSLSFRPNAVAKAVAAAGAERLVESLEQQIGQPVVLAEPGEPA